MNTLTNKGYTTGMHINTCTTYRLMKGKQHELSEVNLKMMRYNLCRLMSIFEQKDLKEGLKRLILYFMFKYGAKTYVLSG